ncbi:MAG: FKBP-type peptidyl-prolyl cis-trans isomerase [Bacteroidota bacterium]
MRIFAILALLAVASTFACQNTAVGNEREVSATGYEYVVHTSAGGEKPQEGDYVYFHAQMRNADSVVFTSRSQGQEPFIQIGSASKQGRPVSPVEDVLKDLSVGDSVTIFISLDTIPNKPRGFENSNTMYYDVVLNSIKNQEEYMADLQKIRQEMAAKADIVKARAPEIDAFAQDIGKKYASGALDSEIQTTASGLKYVIHEAGEGPNAEPGKNVSVQYYGMLTDGTIFDQSFTRGEAIKFPLGVGRVIQGWDEGLALLNKGTKATFFIPSDLGYGATGSPPKIPADAELIFYVELEDIN